MNALETYLEYAAKRKSADELAATRLFLEQSANSLVNRAVAGSPVAKSRIAEVFMADAAQANVIALIAQEIWAERFPSEHP